MPVLLALQAGGAAAVPSTDPVSQGIVGAILVGVFVLLSRETAHRVVIAIGAVALIWGISYLSPYRLITFEGVREALDLNVLVLLASMMAIVGVLRTTGVFEWAVSHVMRAAGGRPLVLLALVAWFTAVASAFLDNVTTVIFVTPMVIGMARQLGMSPAPLLLPMIMAANIGGTATLIGDPPNMMIGSGAGLTFLDFLEDLALPCALMILWLELYTRRYFRHALGGGPPGLSTRAGGDPPVAIANPALARWLGAICAAVLVGFLTHGVTGMPPAVPALMGAAAALIVQDVLYVRKQRPSAHERLHGVLKVTEQDIEWPTLSFFGFLFIIVGAAVSTGLIASLARTLQWAIAAGSAALSLEPLGTLLFAALVICWTSGVLSALIDNIPFVAVSIPIIAHLIPTMSGDASVLWWALSLGACLGGNATVIGASANVTTVGLAERAGTRLSFREFSRFAVPMTAGTLVVASLYLALHVYLGDRRAFVTMGLFLAVAAAARWVQGRTGAERAAAVVR